MALYKKHNIIYFDVEESVLAHSPVSASTPNKILQNTGSLFVDASVGRIVAGKSPFGHFYIKKEFNSIKAR